MIARDTAGGRRPVGLFFAIDLVVHLLPVGLYLDRQRYTVFWPYTELNIQEFRRPPGESLSSCTESPAGFLFRA